MVFRSYPQLIRKLFNAYRFGPPSRVTGTSAWPWVDHLVSRLPPHTQAPCSDSLSLRLRASWRLTSHVTATRRLIMQKARHHRIVSALTACRRTVSGTLSLPCSGCFSPFPHGTCSLSVSGECLALADGPAGFTRGYTCPALLRITPRFGGATDKGLSPSPAGLSRPFSSLASCFIGGPTTPPRPEPRRFGLFPGRSPLLGESHFVFSSCGY